MDLIMDMRPCTEASAAHISNNLALLHLLPDTHDNLLSMAVTRRDTIPMIDIHHVAIPAGVPASRRNHAICRSHDRRTIVIGDIHARMEIRTAPAQPVRRTHIAAGRPNRRNRSIDAVLIRNELLLLPHGSFDLLEIRPTGRQTLLDIIERLAHILDIGLDPRTSLAIMRELVAGDPDNLTTKWWVTNENITENGMYGQQGILYNDMIWHAYKGTIMVSVCCALTAGTIGTLIGYAVSKNRRSRWANYVNSMAFLPYLMPSIAVGVAFFILFSNKYVNLFNTYALLIIVGTVKYIPFASRSSLNSMLQLSGEIEEAAIIQDIPWTKRMTRIIIPIQKTSIISGYLLPFMTCLRELSLFILLCVQGFILSTTLDYFDEMGLYAFSSGINLILIVTILICNALVNKATGASLDKGIGG